MGQDSKSDYSEDFAELTLQLREKETFPASGAQSAGPVTYLTVYALGLAALFLPFIYETVSDWWALSFIPLAIGVWLLDRYMRAERARISERIASGKVAERLLDGSIRAVALRKKPSLLPRFITRWFDKPIPEETPLERAGRSFEQAAQGLGNFAGSWAGDVLRRSTTFVAPLALSGCGAFSLISKAVKGEIDYQQPWLVASIALGLLAAIYCESFNTLPHIRRELLLALEKQLEGAAMERVKLRLEQQKQQQIQEQQKQQELRWASEGDWRSEALRMRDRPEDSSGKGSGASRDSRSFADMMREQGEG